jgi:cytochrome P450 family 33
MLIKKGTICIPQISVFFVDPLNFKNPTEFDPSRFIDEKGQLKKCDELVPFSMGKRACLGEGLARMEMFLFTANLLNRYKFSAGKTPPTLKKDGGGVAFKTQAYKCKVEQRY